jgi:hypothetical protein
VKKLYVIVRENWYDNGRPARQSGQEVLYCGYDRFEAVRAFHQGRLEDDGGRGPGSYYTRTVARSKAVYEEGEDAAQLRGH